MHLLLPDFLTALRRDRISVLLDWAVPRPDRRWSWSRYFGTLAPAIRADSTRKYIFASGEKENTPEHVVRNIRGDALVLMDQGRFRLPHPVCWIEDLFKTIDERYLMLARERNGVIQVWAFLDLPSPKSRPNRFLYLGGVVEIRPAEITDKLYFFWPATPEILPEPLAIQREIIQNIDFAVRRFVVEGVTHGFRPVDDHYEIAGSPPV